MWKTPWWRLGPLVVVFLIVELAFFAANLTKIDHGAWLSLAVGLAFASAMVTWRRGRQILTANRIEEEGSLEAFLATLPDVEPPLDRVPGTAIYLAPNVATTPLALRAEVEHNHVLHETVLIATIEPVSISHVEPFDRCAFAWLGSGRFKVGHITVHIGYRDHVDLPRDLALARKRGLLARDLDLEHATYFVSRMQIVAYQGARDGSVAQGDLRVHGAQRDQPGRELRAARGADRADGAAGPVLISCVACG